MNVLLINDQTIDSPERPKCSYSKCKNSNSTSSNHHLSAHSLKSLLRLSSHKGNCTEKDNHSNSAFFKACHYCYTFYCSRECRLLDWPEHKAKKCYYGRLSSCCKRILSKVGRNYELRYELSKIARAAHSSTNQRGFIWLDFSSANEAQQFMVKPLDLFDDINGDGNKLSNFLFYFGDNLLPKYVCFTPIDNMKMDAKLKSLYTNCKANGDSSFSPINFNDMTDCSISYKSNIVLSLLFHHHFTRLNDLRNRIGSTSQSFSKHANLKLKHTNGCTSCSFDNGVCKKAGQTNHSTHYNMDEDEFKIFNDLCKTYDPETEFLLLASIRINPDDIGENVLPRKPAHSTKNSMYVLKFIKLKLLSGNDKHLKKEKKLSPYSTLTRKLGLFNNNELRHNQQSENSSARNKRSSLEIKPEDAPKDVPLTLILTSLKQSPDPDEDAAYDSMNVSKQNDFLNSSRSHSDNNNVETNEDRQLFLANLLSEFDMRGIKLRQKYPKIYRDLCLYVEENRPFTPVCLFPRDLNKNNLFMCLIMPNSEPSNYSWLYDADQNETQKSEKSQKQEEFHFQPGNRSKQRSSSKSPSFPIKQHHPSRSISKNSPFDLSKYLCIL